MRVCVCVQEQREKLHNYLTTKAGEEPRMVILLNDNEEPSNIYIVADKLEICHLPPVIDSAILVLLGVYFVMNLDFPSYCAQILGLVQHHCLCVDFPEPKRKTGFNTLIQLVQ